MKFWIIGLSFVTLLLGGCGNHRKPYTSVLEEKNSLITQWFGEDHFQRKQTRKEKKEAQAKEEAQREAEEASHSTSQHEGGHSSSEHPYIPSFYDTDHYSESHHPEPEDSHDEDYAYAEDDHEEEDHCGPSLLFSPAGPI